LNHWITSLKEFSPRKISINLLAKAHSPAKISASPKPSTHHSSSPKSRLTGRRTSTWNLPKRGRNVSGFMPKGAANPDLIVNSNTIQEIKVEDLRASKLL
jgi:hypothetical protein